MLIQEPRVFALNRAAELMRLVKNTLMSCSQQHLTSNMNLFPSQSRASPQKATRFPGPNAECNISKPN